jgi:hypothetical protein
MAKSIADVMEQELNDILKRRAHQIRPRQGGPEAGPDKPVEPVQVGGANIDDKMMQLRLRMLNEHVTGLAISGGGIRSGTFAVGFLQGLANLGLLGRFDYLSTVSGGGYAGGWLAAWLKREGDVRNVERQLDYSRIHQAEAERLYFRWDAVPKQVVDEEPEPLRHLRAYSSYLFPRPGVLSGDTWAVVMIWLRNVAINLTMLFPLTMLLVLMTRLAVFCYDAINADQVQNVAWGWTSAVSLLVLGLLGGELAFLLNAVALAEFRGRNANRPPRTTNQANAERARARRVVVASLVAAFGLTASSRWLLWNLADWLGRPGAAPTSDTAVGQIWGQITAHLDLLELPSFFLVMLLFATFMAIGAFILGRRNRTIDWKSGHRFVLAAAMSGATGGFLFVLVLGMVRAFARMNRPDLMATFAVPGALAVVIGSTIIEVAIAGRSMTEAEREWWGRYSARLGIVSALWLLGMGAAIYLPAAFLAGGTAVRVAIASGWLGTSAFGVLTGRYVLPKLQPRGGGRTLARVAELAPPIFLLGLIGLVGLIASLLLNVPGLNAPHGDDLGPFAYYLAGVRGTHWWTILIWSVFFGLLAALGLLLVDVDLFSLHAMYANRLIRCYLGASRPRRSWQGRWGQPRDQATNAGAPSLSERDPMPPLRDENPVTGFDSADDMPLSDLTIGGTWPIDGGKKRTYWGPYLLINTTINLVAGADLAWRDRKGDSFLLSSRFCGSKSVGYAEVDGNDAETRANLTLGRSIAISGAAVDPNMRFYQSPSLTALLSIFNARLGAWMENPYNPKGEWRAEHARFGGWLWTELTGGTDGNGRYVHLSDGGHFENMGVYELIRRRCRYIVALDAGDEATASDSNLAILMRLCRIDFGIRVQIDLGPLRPQGPERLTRSHVAIGRIRYDDADQGQLPGVLVYVRISMTGDEPADLLNYALQDTNFPYQPTDLRQSFDEEQFECYRCLGDHVATDVFESTVNLVPDTAETEHKEYVSRLFSGLQARWADAPETQDEDFVASTQAWIELQRDLRSDAKLARLSSELFPGLAFVAEPNIPASDYARAELHAVSQMLQIMENTWLSLGLRRRSDLPMNRGWINVFRQWANTPTFQRLWPELRPEYGSEFVRFCQNELHLAAPAPRLVQLPNLRAQLPNGGFEKKAIDDLSREYRGEWPAPETAAASLTDLLDRAETLAKAGKPPVWLIVQDRPPDVGGEAFVVGIILAAKHTGQQMEAIFPGYRAPDDARFLDPKTKEPIEFFVWMRRGYRSTNLGAPCVREVLKKHLPEVLGKDPLPTLWARYPKSGEHGDNDAERGTWLTFHARFDFRRQSPAMGKTWKSTLLVR